MLNRSVVVAALLLASTGVAKAQDPEAGQRVFRQCQACHVVDKEQNRVGPHLVGIIGREASAVEDFKYSDAMANADIVWNEETLDAYLADPRGYIPGNRMAFAGLKKEEDRQNVIAYLKSQQ